MMYYEWNSISDSCPVGSVAAPRHWTCYCLTGENRFVTKFTHNVIKSHIVPEQTPSHLLRASSSYVTTVQ